jgi:hypothetical protein
MPRRLRNSVLNGWLKPVIDQVECVLFRDGSGLFIEKGLSSRCIATGMVQMRHRKKA